MNKSQTFFYFIEIVFKSQGKKEKNRRSYEVTSQPGIMANTQRSSPANFMIIIHTKK